MADFMVAKERRFAGKLSEEYDILSSYWEHNYRAQEFFIPAVLAKEIGKKGKHIGLEVGFGTGKTTKIILMAMKNASLVAVDSEPKMAIQTKEKLETFLRRGRLKLITSDACAFLKKQKRGTFDFFVSATTLHNLKQHYRKSLLAEIFRTMKPGAVFINVDYYMPDNKKEFEKINAWQRNWYEKVSKKINRPDLAAEWIGHANEDMKPGIVMLEKESIKQMKTIGFNKNRIIHRDHNLAVLIAKKPHK